jgi:hypothetical protein
MRGGFAVSGRQLPKIFRHGGDRKRPIWKINRPSTPKIQAQEQGWQNDNPHAGMLLPLKIH